MNSSDSAEEVVRLTLEGMEVAFKIAGAGAKNMAVMIYTIMKDKQQTKGNTRLTNMLKTGKPLKIFTIRAEDLKKFSQEAKKYGVLYCALADKKNSKIDGMVDIMVREEDASKMNRIAQRFNFRDIASIERDLELEKQAKQNSVEKVEQVKTEDEQFIDDIMPVAKEEQIETPSNDTKDTEGKSQLESSLNTKSKDKVDNSKADEKKSVKQELKEIAEELEAKEKQEQMGKQDVQINSSATKEKQKQEKKQNKESNKGKHFKEPKHLDTSNRNGRRKRRKERSK